jgi:hypothetical protein
MSVAYRACTRVAAAHPARTHKRLSRRARLLMATTALVAPVMAGPALATDVTFMGSNLGAPTYNRVDPFPQGGTPVLSPTPLVGLVPFVTQTFQATGGGAVTLSLNAGTLVDPFLTVYTAPFNPAMPLANAVAANDDAISGVTLDSRHRDLAR